MRRWAILLVVLALGGGVAHSQAPGPPPAPAPAATEEEGQSTVARLIGWATGGQVRLVGLAGWLPGAPRVERVEVRDAEGPWLVLEDVSAEWSSTALLRGRAEVQSLTAARALLVRRPGGGGDASAGGDLPLQISVAALKVGRLELMPAATGLAAPLVLAISGRLDLEALDKGSFLLEAEGVDKPGRVRAEGTLAPETLALALALNEPADGLVAGIAGLPDLGVLAVTATLDGPRAAPALKLEATAGALRLSASGRLDAAQLALDVVARAPAMTPGPWLSWQAIALDAHVSGKASAPEARGQLLVAALVAGEARLAKLSAELAGDAGRVRLSGRGEGLVLPAPLGAAFSRDPLVLSVDADLQAAERPVVLDLVHPLLHLAGTLRTAGEPQAQVTLDLPALAKLAAGYDGSAQVTLDLALPEGGATGTGEGWLRLQRAPVALLAGRETRFAAAGTRRGARAVLERLTVENTAIGLHGSASLDGDAVVADLAVSLPQLALIAPVLRGAATLDAALRGTMADFAVTLTGSGMLGTAESAPLPMSLNGRVAGLPALPSGRISAEATLEGARLVLEAAGSRAADGTLRLDVPSAQWKSARAEAALVLAPGAALPHGTARLEMGRLVELRPFLPAMPAGSVTAEMARAAGGALSAKVEANGVAPFRRAVLRAQGMPEALALTLDATGTAAVTAASVLDVVKRSLTLSALRVGWQGTTAVLQAPARLDFADGVRTERLRLGIGGGVLDLAGRLTPALDLTASLRGLPAQLAAAELAGTVQGDARLAGTLAAPTGTVRLEASGLRLRTGAAARLPAARLTLAGTLAGDRARLEASAAMGAGRLSANGAVPLGAGALDLRVAGQVPLALLDPILTVEGRRARGLLSLDGRLGGTLRAPVANGTLRLADGELRDDAIGFLLREIDGVVRAEGGRLVVERLDGKAGAGTVAITGTATLAASPELDLVLTARQARPLASELVTATLDADLALRGQVGGDLLASGKVRLDRVDIQLPERMPTQLPTLEVRVKGAKPPPPPPPVPPVALDIEVSAPGDVYVRGRGLEAELRGRVKVGGTLAAPMPDGAMRLRRGTFNLLGTTLDLTDGEVTLGRGNGLDPAIDFTATSRSSTGTATVRVTGQASAPEIRLSSSPELPQDEILGQLLFGRPASQLNALQLAQIAAGLAELSGKTTGLDPLGKLRSGLGLDRLSVGSTESGSATLEAGQNLGRGVYLGVRQGTGDTGTRATVRIDLGRGLKLQGELGTSSGTTAATGAGGGGGSSVGLVWSREW